MLETNGELFPVIDGKPGDSPELRFATEIRRFQELGTATKEALLEGPGRAPVRTFTNEFWTAKQRAGHSLHEVSYRACFKPQLPKFFIERLSEPGDTIYDPFMGRGTTLLEAAFLGRIPMGCDISPLGQIFSEPRLAPPELSEVAERLEIIDWKRAHSEDLREDLHAFYHPQTLEELGALRRHLLSQTKLDPVDSWIRMVATNRLTGHSPGFFSVYSLPPNQAVTIERQLKINAQRNQIPPLRDVKAIILKKSRQLLGRLTPEERERLHGAAQKARLLIASSDNTPEIPRCSVQLVVTSPPFLKVVDYKADNWLRCWFNGIDAAAIPVWQSNRLEQWQTRMGGTFRELKRILKPGGWIAFEVGEVLKGSLNLEDAVIPVAEKAGLAPVAVLVNQQVFTKTANCWGVKNNSGGTNSNRIVLLRKPPSMRGT